MFAHILGLPPGTYGFRARRLTGELELGIPVYERVRGHSPGLRHDLARSALHHSHDSCATRDPRVALIPSIGRVGNKNALATRFRGWPQRLVNGPDSNRLGVNTICDGPGSQAGPLLGVDSLDSDAAAAHGA